MTKKQIISFRVTEERYERIALNAEKSKMTVSKYVESTYPDRHVFILEDIKPFLSKLSSIGNNLNQLTRMANRGQIQSINLQDTNDLLADIYKTINNLLVVIRTGKLRDPDTQKIKKTLENIKKEIEALP